MRGHTGYAAEVFSAVFDCVVSRYALLVTSKHTILKLALSDRSAEEPFSFVY